MTTMIANTLVTTSLRGLSLAAALALLVACAATPETSPRRVKKIAPPTPMPTAKPMTTMLQTKFSDGYLKLLALGAGLALLAGCTATPETAARRVKKAAPPTPTQLVASVRAAGATGVELEVQPLRDPQVEDLRAQATRLESAGKTKKADKVLLQALAISPGDPDLLQWRAELALLGKDWQQAERLANTSFERGPKLGGLCRRNWLTVQFARQRRKSPAAAEVARQQGERCTVAPPVRM